MQSKYVYVGLVRPVESCRLTALPFLCLLTEIPCTRLFEVRPAVVGQTDGAGSHVLFTYRLWPHLTGTL